jgi:5-methylcytosine-specific restriction endonuclease McrA
MGRGLSMATANSDPTSKQPHSLSRALLPFVRKLARLPSSSLATPARPNRYTWRWRRFSEHYRRRFPFCAECFRRDNRLAYEGVLVDHKYPVADGGPMLPGDDGVMTLCVPCHGAKTAMETYARDTGQMDQIIRWCDDPASRPAPFRTWRLR